MHFVFYAVKHLKIEISVKEIIKFFFKKGFFILQVPVMPSSGNILTNETITIAENISADINETTFDRIVVADETNDEQTAASLADFNLFEEITNSSVELLPNWTSVSHFHDFFLISVSYK